MPQTGDVALGDEEAKAKPADFLVTDLQQRIEAGTAKFDLLALLDRPGDPTMDVTVRWHDEDNRESVRLGTIEITSTAVNERGDENIFNPARLADGVGLPPDVMFAARQTAYATSPTKRRAN